MKKNISVRREKGFTLIEIIAVLVILGILAAVAIPKYLDMRKDAVVKAAGGANTELNARERLTLAQWKLQDKAGNYTAPDTKLGADWNSGAAIVSGTAITFQGKQVTFTRTDQANENEPASWAVAVAD